MLLRDGWAAGPTDAFGVPNLLLNQAPGVDRLDSPPIHDLHHLARSADNREFQGANQALHQLAWSALDYALHRECRQSRVSRRV